MATLFIGLCRELKSREFWTGAIFQTLGARKIDGFNSLIDIGKASLLRISNFELSNFLKNFLNLFITFDGI